MKRLLAPALLILVAVRPASGAELTLGAAAIERALWHGLLTQQGRFYIEGAPGESCRYAFIQEPKVTAAAGRLAVRFVFSGRAGTRLAGRCVGPGDTLEITASGTPTYAAGEIRLADLRLTAPESAYFRLLAPLVQARLAERLVYPLRAELERSLLEAAAGGPWRPALARLEVSALRAEAQELRISFDAALTLD